MSHSSTYGREIGLGASFGAVGVILYLLIKNLGLGGHGSGREEHGGPPAQVSPPIKDAQRPTAQVSPPIKDAQRLVFVMNHPTVADGSQTMSFRGSDAKLYALDELIARIRAGGRSDVTLKTAGNVREGAAAAARDQLRQAGIEIWTESGARVSGNARGQYRSVWSHA